MRSALKYRVLTAESVVNRAKALNFIGCMRGSINAGRSSPVARQAHNLKLVSSNLAPATNILKQYQ